MVGLLSKAVNSPALQARLLRMGVSIAGLALDFWKDGPCCLRKTLFLPEEDSFAKKGGKAAQSVFSKNARKESSKANEASEAEANVWIADRIQIAEKMWGNGNALPGGAAYIDNLVAPLGLDETMSVLDLNAGLGGLARRLAFDFNTYVTGLEKNPATASRGMVMSIAAGKSKQAGISVYDPASYTPTRKYDCVIARDLLFKIIGKKKFFTAVAASLKGGGKGQILLTDYILETDNRLACPVAKWLASEKAAAPMALTEMIKEWEALGFDMRVAEDQTALHRREILKGMMRLTEFLTKSIPPSAETKRGIAQEINLWARRVMALEGGLKYYRLHGIKK